MAGLSVLVVNAGSTSLKLSAVEDDDSSAAVDSLAVAPDEVTAVAHRVVHGGARFREPVLIDDDVLRELERLFGQTPLAVSATNGEGLDEIWRVIASAARGHAA